ncbi:glycosyl transferase family protein [Rivularia sp. IAM M-261]|nr:glycosyl transferase family protein [Rivularia sp. IAM M-261]
MRPKVSIIIPTYNTQSYINKAIESALSQTITDIEIIVVDDASTDASVDNAKQFSDCRLQIFVNPKNLGAGLTRNYGLQKAKGEWIALLDSDDWYAPERLEKLLHIANTENADVVADNLMLIYDGATTPHGTQIDISSNKLNAFTQVDTLKFLQADTCGKFPLFSCTKPIIKRDFLNRYNLVYDTELARLGEDFRFYLRCLVRGAKFFFTPEAYYFQRLRQGSLTTQSMISIINDFYLGNQNLLKEAYIQEHPDVVKFLDKDAKVLRNKLSYYTVVETIKDRKWLHALQAMVLNPYFFILFSLRLPQILYRRLS